MADQAGTMLSTAATKNEADARKIHSIVQEGIVITNLFPSVDGLPEGIPGDVFQSEFGGLGGAKTRALLGDIKRRLRTCTALTFSK